MLFALLGFLNCDLPSTALRFFRSLKSFCMAEVRFSVTHLHTFTRFLLCPNLLTQVSIARSTAWTLSGTQKPFTLTPPVPLSSVTPVPMKERIVFTPASPVTAWKETFSDGQHQLSSALHVNYHSSRETDVKAAPANSIYSSQSLCVCECVNACV